MNAVQAIEAHYVDLFEAARILTIHAESLRRLVKQEKLPARLYGGRYWLERAAVERFKNSYDPRPGRKPMRRLI